ncbi:MAG TPA: AraC family transcriptional regulator [Balneolaceae bacterium]|nr:AraC family transcriptional regulator [Balneolaceae bacterium]|tara:strand:- start:14656 stop:16713 length:2058 start_codon:yes stop_codon:yes gene_type:complete
MQEDFISKITTIIEKKAGDEQFGVSELADAMNMSRSNLLRKIKAATGRSASQYIRRVRLEIAMEMLKEEEFTVSEISWKVGFVSTSYFIKCFREEFGYPPGEVGKQQPELLTNVEVSEAEDREASGYLNKVVALAAVIVLTLSIGWAVADRVKSDSPKEGTEKSIAVLPFKNESSDSSNVYFINGLMESTLSNLQKIEDLRVISRTSVEKFRNSTQTIPEIAEELNTRYLVEGSGQKVGDKVLLHIQLIDAYTDRHVWAEQYSREIADVFSLQNEVATKIATSIEAIITPSEMEQIDKIPTDDLQAYDYYLQAMEHFHRQNKEGLEIAIPLFEKAIERDPEFALAYADLAISYYFLEIYQIDKQYTDLLNLNADKALLYDPKSAESLIAKAFYYMQVGEYRLAVPHLEKALEYNPNSSAVIQTLADLYARYIPNTEKYLEYALKGNQLEIAANDSIQQSYLYLHLSNAFIQNGFVDEAQKYINLSLDYNPNNEFRYLKPFVTYAKDHDMKKMIRQLVQEFERDTTRLDIMQEIGKAYFFEHQFDSSYIYYSKFVRDRERFGLQIFPNENAKISYVFGKVGETDKAAELFADYEAFCKEDESIYQSINRALLFAHKGEIEQGMEQLKEFAAQNNYQYWVVLFLEDDPLIDPLKSHPDFENTIQRIKDRFRENKATLEEKLEEKGLM